MSFDARGIIPAPYALYTIGKGGACCTYSTLVPQYSTVKYHGAFEHISNPLRVRDDLQDAPPPASSPSAAAHLRPPKSLTSQLSFSLALDLNQATRRDYHGHYGTVCTVLLTVLPRKQGCAAMHPRGGYTPSLGDLLPKSSPRSLPGEPVGRPGDLGSASMAIELTPTQREHAVTVL